MDRGGGDALRYGDPLAGRGYTDTPIDHPDGGAAADHTYHWIFTAYHNHDNHAAKFHDNHDDRPNDFHNHDNRPTDFHNHDNRPTAEHHHRWVIGN